MHNILEDPCIAARCMDGTDKKLNLPEVFESLGKNAIKSFPNLRPHQRHVWHAFLCQLAAIAITDGEVEVPNVSTSTPLSELSGVHSAEEWRKTLYALAPDPDAWSMIVEDIQKPAFLQCPASINNGLARHTPDDLDDIITSKNVYEKETKITSADIDHWIYALVSRQGQGGFTAAGASGRYYGTYRRNGGYAARPGVGVISSPAWGDQWGRDTRVLIDTLYDGTIEWDENAHRLLWLVPWDLESSIGFSKLHPYCLDICVAVRLETRLDRIVAVVAGSKVPRVEAKVLQGVVGDPWIPCVRRIKKTKDKGGIEEIAAYNGSLNWRDTAQILMDKATHIAPVCLEIQPYDRAPLYARMFSLVRGQGRTDAIKEKLIFIPAEKRHHLRSSIGARVVNSMVSSVKTMQKDVLIPSLYRLYGKDGGRGKKPIVESAISLFDGAVSDRFYFYLWEILPEAEVVEDAALEARLESWTIYLRTKSREIFEEGLERALHSGEEYLKIADADISFRQRMKKHFPISVEGKEKQEDE